MDGALEALEEVDAHEALHTALASRLGQVLRHVVRERRVFVPLARMDVVRRGIDAECELHELLVDLAVVDCARTIRELRTTGDGFQACGEFANGVRVIIFLDVSA